MGVLRSPRRTGGTFKNCSPARGGPCRGNFRAGFFFFFFIFPSFLLHPQEDPAPELNVEALREKITREAGAELLSLDIGDTDVSFFASGYWKGTLTGSWGIALTPLGTTAVSGDSPILFQQEADLTLSLWIRRRWFVEASFLDDYDLNTYRAGYQGQEGEFVQYVGVGNTGLDFPKFPYLDLGGDSPSSLGVYGKFGTGPLTIHSLVRYDAAVREERTFVGDRERTYAFVPLDTPLRGLSFVLPDTNIPAVPTVYFEDSNGSLQDPAGRRWRLAQASEYAVSAQYGLLELTNSAGGMVAVSYPGGYAGMGTSYTTPGFLGDVQNYFGPTIDLSQYPQPGGGAGIPGTVSINGVNALVVYEPGTFSPFERQSRYGAPTSAAADASLVTVSTGDRIAGFEVLPVADISLSTNIPLYSTPAVTRGIYELISAGNVSSDRRDVRERWPLGDIPEIYLPGKKPFTGDRQLRFTSYGSAGYSIGTDVVPGSVQVFRGGGLEDPNFSYSPQSGIVNLQTPAGINEVIRITYLKRSAESQMGSIAAGLGAIYDPEGPFSSELGIGVRWNMTQEGYTEEGSSSPGTVGLGGKLAWDYDNFKSQVTLGFGFEQPDTTGLYRIAGMEGSEVTLGLSDSDSFISEVPANSPSTPPLYPPPTLTAGNRAPLVYRNFRSTDLLGSTSLMDINWSGASIVSGRSGPYLAKDSSMYVLAAEFSLDSVNTWTGFQAPLGENGDLLERAKEILIPYRFHNFTPASDFKVIVQFGSLSDKDAGGFENGSLLAERDISDSNNYYADSSSSYRIGRVILTDDERRKLQDARYMRILLIDDTVTPSGSGVVLTAPPVIMGAGFRPIMIKNGGISTSDIPGAASVSAVEQMDLSLQNDTISRLHSENTRQRVLEVSWHDLTAGESAGVDGRVSAIPLSNYRTLTFFLKGPTTDRLANLPPDSGSEFRFVIARGPEHIFSDTALDARIPAGAFTPGGWSKVEIRYGGGDNAVYVNGSRTGGSVSYRPAALRRKGSGAPGMGGFSDDASDKPGYITLILNPGAGSSLAPSPYNGEEGTFSVDEIILEDPSPFYRFNGGTVLEWKRPGELISYRGTAIVSDLGLSTAMETGVRGDPATPETEVLYGVQDRSRAEAVLLGAKVYTDLAFLTANDYAYWNAGHGISRSWGPFSAGESFHTDPYDLTMNHRLSLGWSSPISALFDSDISYGNERLQRAWKASLGFKPNPNTSSGVSLDTDWRLTENTDAPEEWMPNYAETWGRSWEPMLPDLGGDGIRRDLHGLFKASLDRTPVGVQFSLDGSSAFSRPVNNTQSATTERFDFPFVFGDYRGLFRWERYFMRSLFYSGDTYLDDEYKYLESLADTPRLWFEPPVYSLFDPYLEKTMASSLNNSRSRDITERGRFNDKYAFSLQLPGRYDLSAFVIPNTFQYQIDRTLEQKLDTWMDVLNTSASLGFQAVNMFGSFGAAPLFKFYANDQFTHTLSGSVAIPKGEDLSWRLQAEQSAAFYGFLGAELSLANTFTIGDSGWVEGLTLGWTAPANKSLLGFLYAWTVSKVQSSSTWPALSDLAASEYERLRKETLELVIDNSTKYTQFSLILGHESIIRIMGRLYLSVFAKLNCTQDERTEILSFLGTVGTTLNITF
jgi:hypothetical protein